VKGIDMTTTTDPILPTRLEDLVALFDVRHTDTPTPDADRAEALRAPKFGTAFTDHMARISWTSTDGWKNRRIEKYGPLQLDPATAVLHYAQEIFEGLKAYKHADGSVWTFRPDQNAARFARSAHRLALPALSVDDFIGSLAALVRTDIAWVPDGEDSSLYLRPFMYASEAFLGVRPALEVEYLVIASPVGPYFSGGVRPVSIYVSEEYHRAGPPG
jgi:branched-chain amino acid aminotransferase